MKSKNEAVEYLLYREAKREKKNRNIYMKCNCNLIFKYELQPRGESRGGRTHILAASEFIFNNDFNSHLRHLSIT